MEQSVEIILRQYVLTKCHHAWFFSNFTNHLIVKSDALKENVFSSPT